MRALGQRRCAVQHVTRVFNNLGAAHRVVAFAFFSTVGFRDHVGAIQRIVQRAPARVGGIECIARIQNGHHELRACLFGQFCIHIGSGDGDRFWLRHQVADFSEKSAVGLHVSNRAGVGLVPVVHFNLKAVTLGQQRNIFRRQVGYQGIKAFPEIDACNASSWQDFVFNKTMQYGGHL